MTKPALFALLLAACGGAHGTARAVPDAGPCKETVTRCANAEYSYTLTRSACPGKPAVSSHCSESDGSLSTDSDEVGCILHVGERDYVQLFAGSRQVVINCQKGIADLYKCGEFSADECTTGAEDGAHDQAASKAVGTPDGGDAENDAAAPSTTSDAGELGPDSGAADAGSSDAATADSGPDHGAVVDHLECTGTGGTVSLDIFEDDAYSADCNLAHPTTGVLKAGHREGPQPNDQFPACDVKWDDGSGVAVIAIKPDPLCGSSARQFGNPDHGCFEGQCVWSKP